MKIFHWISRSGFGMIFAGALMFLLPSCGSLKIGNRSELASGYYRTSSGTEVYVDEDESGFIHLYEDNDEGWPEWKKAFKPKAEYDESTDTLHLTRNSFDLDLITVPVKFHPSTQHLPAQLTTNLSAALFMGFRKDFHKIHYETKPLGSKIRKVSNLGFAVGALSGFGNTAMNESTTAGYQDREYDGIVWMYGLDAIVGWNDLTFGLAVGKDVLLDRNRPHWIYHRKLWYGLTIGLNLN